MPQAAANLVYSCEPWEIDLGRRELRSGGSQVPLGSRAFEIIEILAQAAGQLVTKDDLMERIWPGAVVGENTLHVHISAVRKALGPDRGMLKTSPGRGYRLVGDWNAQQVEPPDLPASRSRPQPADRPPTNFPLLVTQLVGRAAAVARIRDLVSAYRVVTLTGPGGIGKTALAMKAVRGLLPDYADGAWLVELASLADASLAPSAVAAALQLKLGGGPVTAEALAQAIGARHVLLVLDNCEHLIDAVAALAEAVLRGCPRATILSTSREMLRIQGEAVYRVPALDVPAPALAPQAVLEHSAVALFVARWQALDVGFSPEPEDLTAIAEICRRLDGIPLAIEFAAAQAALVGADQVAVGLSSRFALLTSGRRTAIPRHRTLRAALDWSYQLLSEEERRLLRHLAVFPAGFTLEAAQAVAAGDGRGRSIVEDLSSLVSKSLCERSESTPRTRWRLLETVRAYAMEKLAEQGEHASASRGHAAYFRHLASAIVSGSPVWLSSDDVSRCGRELDNVRAALDWAYSPDGDGEIGAGLTAAFAPIWQMMSLMGECRERVERMLASASVHLEASAEWRMWIAYAHALTMTLAPVDRAREAVRKALRLAAGAVDDVELRAGLLYTQWSIEFMSGDYRAALDAARSLITAMSEGSDSVRLAGDRVLGTSLLYAGDLAGAEEHLRRVVDFYAAPSGGHHSALFVYDLQVLARARLARVLSLRGKLDLAFAEARSAFELSNASGAGITACWVLQDALCPLAFMKGDMAAAEEAVAALGDWAARMNAALWKMMATCWRGKLLIERGEFARGIELISRTLEACEQSGWQMCYARFLGYLAEGLAGLGRFEEAGAKLDSAIDWAERRQELWYKAELERMRGELLLRRSLTAEAEGSLQAAGELARAQGALLWELRIALCLARTRVAQRRAREAARLLAPVYNRFTEGFDAPDLRAARALLEAPSR